VGKGRLEAFSDGVIAIIITIMVLELKVPHGTELAALEPYIPLAIVGVYLILRGAAHGYQIVLVVNEHLTTMDHMTYLAFGEQPPLGLIAALPLAHRLCRNPFEFDSIVRVCHTLKRGTELLSAHRAGTAEQPCHLR
jgi:hypothetical protein